MVALESQTRRSAKRWFLIGGFLVASAVAVVVAVGSMPNPAMERARNESVRVLSLATDASAMEDAVGSLGIIFHLADGAWIAVRYVDCHALPIWSSGVALDSKGRWFESDVHFCGQFKIYRIQWERTLEVLQNPQTTRDEKQRWLETCPLEPAPLRELEGSGDLEAARAKLLGLGFREMKGGTIPKMTGAWPGKVETKDAIVKKLLL